MEVVSSHEHTNGESEDNNGDGDGIWSPDIEMAFQKALLLHQPCGRRKTILQEEGNGKMYGRNELIARYIFKETGKKRTRKQVSSHIQVLARRKAKMEGATGSIGGTPSPSSIDRSQSTNSRGDPEQMIIRTSQAGCYDVWLDRPIVTHKIRLVEFSAFIEHRNFHSPPLSLSQTNNATVGHQLGSSSNLATTVTDIDWDIKSNINMMQDFQACQPVQQHQQQHTHQNNIHPLASNHQLPSQFNNQTNLVPPYQANHNGGQHLQLQYQNQNHLQWQSSYMGRADNHNTAAAVAAISTIQNHHHQQQQPISTSTGVTRHSYVQIDYTQPMGRQANKLEHIDIVVIQDKFPEIGGPDGLFQRGPSDAFFLVKFWADLNNDYEYNIQDQNSYFGFSSHFETVDPYKSITCSTKACSYGQQVVEKVEKVYGNFNSFNGRYSYAINRSPMCEFMIQFIKKLRQLPMSSQMNSVLENFTVLQVITSECTSEILLCLAYVFEVAISTDQNNGPQYHVYKLTRD